MYNWINIDHKPHQFTMVLIKIVSALRLFWLEFQHKLTWIHHETMWSSDFHHLHGHFMINIDICGSFWSLKHVGFLCHMIHVWNISLHFIKTKSPKCNCTNMPASWSWWVYPPVSKRGNWKSPRNLGFNRKITELGILYFPASHFFWLAEGKSSLKKPSSDISPGLIFSNGVSRTSLRPCFFCPPGGASHRRMLGEQGSRKESTHCWWVIKLSSLAMCGGFPNWGYPKMDGSGNSIQMHD